MEGVFYCVILTALAFLIIIVEEKIVGTYIPATLFLLCVFSTFLASIWFSSNGKRTLMQLILFGALMLFFVYTACTDFEMHQIYLVTLIIPLIAVIISVFEFEPVNINDVEVLLLLICVFLLVVQTIFKGLGLGDLLIYGLLAAFYFFEFPRRCGSCYLYGIIASYVVYVAFNLPTFIKRIRAKEKMERIAFAPYMMLGYALVMGTI